MRCIPLKPPTSSSYESSTPLYQLSSGASSPSMVMSPDEDFDDRHNLSQRQSLQNDNIDMIIEMNRPLRRSFTLKARVLPVEEIDSEITQLETRIHDAIHETDVNSRRFSAKMVDRILTRLMSKGPAEAFSDEDRFKFSSSEESSGKARSEAS
eukprot:GHVH01004478.1.p1 GENE.GHVH01004478.1~~GHVH01004478.1.p1  ORF type:complete len:153 (+),score=29.09 GHVH01004478.1:134-592(+)